MCCFDFATIQRKEQVIFQVRQSNTYTYTPILITKVIRLLQLQYQSQIHWKILMHVCLIVFFQCLCRCISRKSSNKRRLGYGYHRGCFRAIVDQVPYVRRAPGPTYVAPY